MVETELKDYDKAITISRKDDPLQWWKGKKHQFPLLSQLARQYLAVQATSAPPERIFSVASRIITNMRTQMKPEVASQLEFLFDHWENWEDDLAVLKLVVGRKEGLPKEG